ncbi:MAG: sodium:proton antiporter [Gemmataceae bacterium]|nr:sodium:proton antiporter [Gemmataceae bacterium]MDW8264996.1 sodium:proton antiporter [Gemmataceae bacterium]
MVTGLTASLGASLPGIDPGPLELPAWTVVPFALLLVSIAVLPLVAEHFWHRDRNKAVVALVFAAPVAAYLVYLSPKTQGRSLAALEHGLAEYASFIVLLGALYIVAGGIAVRVQLPPTPGTNTLFLAFGSVLANVIGTTGASMVLIRPVLRVNRQRTHANHVPIFFIFSVSNLGGLLTPLGDPPLFLGFLNGVDFFWTLSLWRPWLMVNGLVLAMFFAWDSLAYRREIGLAVIAKSRPKRRLRLNGRINFLFLAGIVIAVLAQSERLGGLPKPWGEVIMLAMASASLLFTRRRVRQVNGFTFGPIREVAILFAGIFVTMVPAIELLKVHGSRFGLTQPWQFFWLTGLLSSFLDNAPTYLTFATMAAGPNSVGWLATARPEVLAAISCGAVFMGANTYIGNGPNFMVKAIADEAGYRTPAFFGYMAYSTVLLLPVFLLATLLFF